MSQILSWIWRLKIPVQDNWIWGYFNSVLVDVLLWKIWLARNRNIFDNASFNSYEIVSSSSLFAHEITQSFQSTICANPRPVRLVSWSFPGARKLKLNTDGCSRGNPGQAGYGRVFREERGHWILGFFGRLEECTSLEAELWGLFRGLELVHNQGMEPLEIESDSTAAIALINEQHPEHSPHLILIKECKALKEITGCSLKHTLREGNKVADKLANMGADQADMMVSHITPMDEIIPLLEADMRGVMFERF